jgi:hypothetical protein
MMERTQRAFRLGQIVATPAAIAEVHPEDMRRCLNRHACCDWGDCGKEDAQSNEEALDQELRLFSVYKDRNGTKFWIITEADRSATTILLPEDY